MKIFLSSNFYPIKNADGFCVQNIIENLDEKIELFTVGEEGNYCINNCNVRVIKKGLLDSLNLNNTIELILYKLIQFILFPDTSVFNSKKLIKKVKDYLDNNKNNNCEVISFSGDISSQIVAMNLKKIYPDIIWKSVYYDPLPDKNPVYKNKLCFLFPKNILTKNLIKTADKIYMTKGIFDYYTNQYDTYKYKMQECGLPMLDINLYDSSLNNTSEPYEFLYCGTLNRKVRNPEKMFSFFEYLKKNNIGFKITMVGSFSNDIKQELSKYNCIFKGKLTKQEVIRLYSSKAYILICLGNTNKIQTPSKVLEYISTGHKIIDFEEIEESQSRIILEKYTDAFIVDKNDKFSRDKINRFLKSDDQCTKEYILNNYSDFLPKQCAEKICEKES